MSVNDEDENKTPAENFRRTLDLHDAQLNQITTNNREVRRKIRIWKSTKSISLLVDQCSKSTSTIKIWIRKKRNAKTNFRIRINTSSSTTWQANSFYTSITESIQSSEWYLTLSCSFWLFSWIFFCKEQIKTYQTQLNDSHQIQEELKEKERRIKELENETETLHDRERFDFDLFKLCAFFFLRRIAALNEQIQKMESKFSF